MLVNILVALQVVSQVSSQRLATRPLPNLPTLSLDTANRILAITVTPTLDPSPVHKGPDFHLAGHGDDRVTTNPITITDTDTSPFPRDTNDPDRKRAALAPLSTAPTNHVTPAPNGRYGTPTLSAAPPSAPSPPSTPSTPHLPFPTALLAQIPSTWPYTAYGVGRKPETKTWTLTDGEGRRAGEVRHEVVWWGRPLRKSGVGGVEGEGKNGWRRTFLVAGGSAAVAGGEGGGGGEIEEQGEEAKV
ncbi:hypothetical protein SVAN01_07788 [Stagonosporopsis vannaccii]|nr:hypothetical protein SVAN01_07788 [Stagonosporopsis vannaccii]